ncbi:MAG: hypothetical protein V1725_05950 [archaeon]
MKPLEDIARTTEDINTVLELTNDKYSFIEELQKNVSAADVQPLNDLALHIGRYVKEQGYTLCDSVQTDAPLLVMHGTPTVMLGIAKGEYLGDLLLHSPDTEKPADGFYYTTNWLFMRGTQLSERKSELDQYANDLVYQLMKKFDVRIDLQD